MVVPSGDSLESWRNVKYIGIVRDFGYFNITCAPHVFTVDADAEVDMHRGYLQI